MGANSPARRSLANHQDGWPLKAARFEARLDKGPTIIVLWKVWDVFFRKADSRDYEFYANVRKLD